MRFHTLWRHIVVVVATATAGLILMACGQGYDMARGEAPRDDAPDASDAELSELVAGNNAFAFELYQAMREERDGNFVFSPYSISRALAMAYAGARGETEQEMAEVLHFTLTQERLHPAFNALDLELASRGEEATGPFRDVVSLDTPGAIWGQPGSEFQADYLDTLARHYDAGVYLADFAGAPDDARGLINGWIGSETEERVAERFPPGAITQDTSLVLTSTTTFDATWYTVFHEDNTTRGSFLLLDGTAVDASIMRRLGALDPSMRCSAYADPEGAVEVYAIEMLYRNDDLGMMLLFPQSINFAQLEDMLDDGLVEALSEGQENCGQLPFFMPRFEIGEETDLGPVLSGMGMRQAFLPAEADFSGIAAGDSTHLDIVDHAPFIEVYEGGSVTTPAENPPERFIPMPTLEEDLVITVNQPFIFVIHDRPTHTILFMGRVLDPR